MGRPRPVPGFSPWRRAQNATPLERLWSTPPGHRERWDAYALYTKRASQASRLDAVAKTGPRGRLERLGLINNR